MRKTVLLLLATVMLPSCRPSSPSDAPVNGASDVGPGEQTIAASPFAATASLLAVALRDVLESDESVSVLDEPEQQFDDLDLNKNQLQQFRGCEILFRFGFQGSIDQQIGDDSGVGQPRIVAVDVPGGMCQPDSYLAICQRIGQALVRQERLSREQADQRAAALVIRLQELFSWMRNEIASADLRYAPVLASESQNAFCQQLGLNVAATFSDAQTTSERPGGLDRAVDAAKGAETQFIITSPGKEREVAGVLADRTGARVVEFGRVPTSHDAGAFDEMVRENVHTLIDAAAKALDAQAK